MAKMNKILKKIMDISYPFCRHGSTDKELIDFFRKINNAAHEAQLIVRRKNINDHKSNNLKDSGN